MKRADLRSTMVRVGMAPYVAAFEDLHSWLILEWVRQDFGDEFLLEDTTPLFEIFYRNVLFEIGQSFNGFTKFNYIVHF